MVEVHEERDADDLGVGADVPCKAATPKSGGRTLGGVGVGGALGAANGHGAVIARLASAVGGVGSAPNGACGEGDLERAASDALLAR